MKQRSSHAVIKPVASRTLPVHGKTLSDEDRRRSIEQTMLLRPDQGMLWVFAYGSLLWRPEFVPAELQVAHVYGWHRALTIHAVAGRGSAESPGLWFGLEPGGSVWGVAMQVCHDQVCHVLRSLWRREMPDDAYAPRWVTCHLPRNRHPAGSVPTLVHALAFVSNPASALYAGKMDPGATALRMHAAAGPAGHARCYALRTQAALKQHGLRDHRLDTVAATIRRDFGPCRLHVCAIA